MDKENLILQPQESLEDFLWKSSKIPYEKIRKFIDAECYYQSYQNFDSMDVAYLGKLAEYICIPLETVKQLITLENQFLGI